jgi:serine/threonine protein kinase/tetratricopeptide (TPR) repeat protein
MFRLDKDLWDAVSPLLDRALELDRAGRAALVSDIGRERPQLAQALARLLEEHERLLGSDFLECPPTTLDGSSPSLAGQTIGPYRLDVPLGMGGMGSVWRAQRIDGRFEGFVAIKLLNLALVGHDGDERFRREGTLLARLAHPHIARLLDAGVTSTGQPYLVLEYVEGIRIDHFADAQRLSPAKRLELFLQVTDAVAHAHASLIVHRDLKPSNILVAGDGQVKLLDFGIGKLLAGESERQTGELTQPATQALTPEYAAPEQARGDLITTAADVYALGVLLYVLLTGRHPTGADCRTPAEYLQALLERDPVRPSDAALAPAPQEAAARAELRHATPERLRRLCRGDIDNLLGKALEKAPERRYVSVTAFADDIRRFLNHEPLTVHGKSWTYRTAKFVRRHRWPVAAAIIAFTMLSAGLVIAERQRRVAERRFDQLRHLSQQVFDLDDRIRNLAGATEARQALVAASLEYLAGLARDAGGDLDLRQEVADGYWRVARIQGVPIGLTLGDFAKAEQSLKKGDELVEVILASHPGDRRALERSAVIAHDRMIVADSERRDDDALSHARKAIERMDAFVSTGVRTESERKSAMDVYANVAAGYVNLHHYDEAIRTARRLLESSFEVIPRSISYAWTVIANARRSQGDLDGALEAIRAARQIGRQSADANETKQMIDRYPLLLREAFILGEDRGVSLNRPAEAAALLREAFAMHEAGARRDPNDFMSRTRVGTTGRELGDILRWRAPADAVAVYDVALARLAEIRNNVKARRDRARILASSSYALRRLERPAEAKRRIDEALTILTETKDHPADHLSLDSELCSVLQAMADHLADEGRVSEAIGQYEKLLEKVMAARPDVDHDLREAYSLSLLYRDLARLYKMIGAAEQAAPIDAKRRAIWNSWIQRLPGNPFVLEQLAATDRDVAGPEQSRVPPSSAPAATAQTPGAPDKRPPEP